jgi:hypothetical protein
MPLDEKLNKYTTAPDAIATFDFQDIETGLGFVDFFAATTNPVAGDEFILTDRVEFSHKISSTRNSEGTTTLTFTSSPFNLARVIKGIPIFSCGSAAGGGNTNTVTVKLQKWDGTDATDLSLTIAGSPEGDVTMVLLEVPLTNTEEVIAQGDSLRIIVTQFQSGAGVTEIGTDPAGRDGVNITSSDATTVMKISIPFKIE